VVAPPDLDDARSIIAGSRVLVGARMHACLNALSTGVPAIAMSYSRKFATAPRCDRLAVLGARRRTTGTETAARVVELLADPSLPSRLVEPERWGGHPCPRSAPRWLRSPFPR
jgi:hypothetical protein